MAGQQTLQGRLGAQIDLRGLGRTLNGLEGSGRVWLRDANVYELPVMIAMLKILSFREPSPTAFSKADVQFQIRGNHIYLSPIDFNGDAISLLGQGQMDFQSNINLAFHAVVGPQRVPSAADQPVDGRGQPPDDDDQRRTGRSKSRGRARRCLPGVKQALAQLEAELRPAAPPCPLFPTAREVQPRVNGTR